MCDIYKETYFEAISEVVAVLHYCPESSGIYASKLMWPYVFLTASECVLTGLTTQHL